MRRPSGILVVGLLSAFGGACVPASAPAAREGAVAAEPHRPAASLPPGYGTLRQDEFTVSLRDDALLVKVTPLAEEVIRLAAPDTYDRLHALTDSRRGEATSRTGIAAPALFLVSFFSYAPDTPFQPEDLQLVQQGRLLRPRAVLPLTPAWGAQRLRQQEVHAAVYAYDAAIDPDTPFVVRYGSVESDEWARILTRLRVERAKAAARAGW